MNKPKQTIYNDNIAIIGQRLENHHHTSTTQRKRFGSEASKFHVPAGNWDFLRRHDGPSIDCLGAADGAVSAEHPGRQSGDPETGEVAI